MAFRHRLRLPVADKTEGVDKVNAVYEKPSNFRVCRSNATIGGGLFSCKMYENNERIATFNGNVTSSDMYEVEKLADRGGYAIQLSTDNVLNCYQQRIDKECMASVANDARYCIDQAKNNASAINNCRLVIDRSKDIPRAYLRAISWIGRAVIAIGRV